MRRSNQFAFSPAALLCASLLTAGLLSACVGSKTPTAGGLVPPPPPVNDLVLTVDTGPAAATGQINHGYVTVKVCTAGSASKCANIDHVLVDTDSTGLRLVGSVLTAAGVTLGAATDAQGQTVEECVNFGGGQVWGPVALADLGMAGETAAKVPVQVLDDTGGGAPPPATCGANGTLINSVAALGANGMIGVGVFAQDCGAACVSAAPPLPVYFGCTSAGVCTAENTALANQVANPVAMFAADNNGVIVDLPNLVNANGDTSVSGQLIFGIGTQSDNALPATGLTVLGTDPNGDFTATYNGGNTVLPAVIDSGTDSYAFDDPVDRRLFDGRVRRLLLPGGRAADRVRRQHGRRREQRHELGELRDRRPELLRGRRGRLREPRGRPRIGQLHLGHAFFLRPQGLRGIEQRTAGSYTGPFFAY